MATNFCRGALVSLDAGGYGSQVRLIGFAVHDGSRHYGLQMGQGDRPLILPRFFGNIVKGRMKHLSCLF